ncbi:hypothetical protein [Streptomyces daliensis]|uniref:Uncharacterized protein n=1 Tax=Streptomyces daliensis TaxID=299421 RepID=A0A8T4IW54_9ACTN|nr:hypothetical protein [Streptomyces daliensis]
MLALRLIRGSHPLVLLSRLLVACAMAGVGFLLLASLSHALAHPGQPAASVARLLWCLVPLAAAVQLAVAVARTDPGPQARSALDTVRSGPGGVPALAAVSTAVSCLLGSAVALLVFLHLRGELTGMPFDGAASGLLAADRPLPVAAALTLLCVAPVLASCTAFALSARTARPARLRAHGGDRDRDRATMEARTVRAASSGGADTAAPATDDTTGPAPLPGSLPWGAALTAAGLALETYASRSQHLPVPRTLEGIAPGVLGGWLLIAVGLVLAGPGLTHLCGTLLTTCRPGAVRLLAGRVLREEAARVGRPLGTLCAVVAGTLVAARLYAAAPGGGLSAVGPMTALGIALVLACALLSVLTSAAEWRSARVRTNAALVRVGAPRKLLRRAAALRAAVLLVALGSLTWALSVLASLPVLP